MFLPDLTGERRWNRKKVALWTLVAVLLLGLALSARPAYRSLKAHRAENIAVEAERLVAEEKWEEAHQRAQAALQLHQRNPRALRCMARLLAQFRQPQAFSFWALLLESEAATPEDRQELIELALALQKFDVAGFYLDQALATPPVPAVIFRLAARLSELRGEPAQVVRFARSYLQRQPGDAEMQLVLARHLLLAGQPQESQEARQLLWSVARANPAGTTVAIPMLARLPNLSRDETLECFRMLEQVPNRHPAQELLARELQIRLEPERRAEIIASVIVAHRNGGLDELLHLARWLNRLGEAQQVVATIPLQSALQQQDLFLSYADAMAAVGRWAELQPIMAGEQLPLEPVLVELYRARIAMELKDDRRAELHWGQVHWLASENPQALLYVAEYTERLGLHEEAARAYRKLTRESKLARGAFVALIRLAELRGDTAALRNLMQELIKQFPEDPAPRNDLTYLQLLLQENLAAAKASAQQLLKAHPDRLAYRTTLALAHLRFNEVADARALYAEKAFPWEEALPGWQAVHVAVLGASGETETARQLAGRISHERLKPEERRLIQAWQ